MKPQSHSFHLIGCGLKELCITSKTALFRLIDHRAYGFISAEGRNKNKNIPKYKYAMIKSEKI